MEDLTRLRVKLEEVETKISYIVSCAQRKIDKLEKQAEQLEQQINELEQQIKNSK